MAIEHRQLLFSFLAGLCIFFAGLAAQLITTAFLPLTFIGGAISLAAMVMTVKHYRQSKTPLLGHHLEDRIDAL